MRGRYTVYRMDTVSTIRTGRSTRREPEMSKMTRGGGMNIEDRRTVMGSEKRGFLRDVRGEPVRVGSPAMPLEEGLEKDRGVR